MPARSALFAMSMLFAWVVSAVADPPAAKFTKPPTAAKTGDKVKIDFAVDRQTDVAVFIEDANGRVVRHLVAGVLGKNPPLPLKADSLEQSVVWDGQADWDKPAGAGPFKVRVALGLGAKYDKAVIADPISTGGVSGLAAGPDGTLYAVVGAGAGVPNWASQRLIAINRDGSIQRTLVPPPSNATGEQIKALGGIPVQVGGRTVPMYLDLPQRRNTAFWSSDGVAVTPDGQFLVLHPDARIGLVDVTGGQAPPDFLGPKLLPKVPAASFHTLDHRQYLAVSGDGKHAYFSGIAPKRSYSSEKTPPYPVIYRVKLPDRSPADAGAFFGDPETPGNDETHLGGMPRGMAADGKGNLLICDLVNNRVVVVSESDGKFARSFPAENAEFVAANRDTGEVYLLKNVSKGGNSVAELVKLSGWKDAKPVASAKLPSVPKGEGDPGWQFAVDTSARPAVLWVTAAQSPLLRIEDLGDKFSDAVKIGGGNIIGDGGFVNLSVDHYRDDPEIYVRTVRGVYDYRFARYNEKTEKVDVINPNVVDSAAGSCVEVGPDGNLYVQAYPSYLLKFDRNGKPLKWDVPFVMPEGQKGSGPTHAIFSRVIMVYMTHTLGVRPDGHLFVFEGHPTQPNKDACHALFEYAPSGARVGGPIVWKTSDSIIGPRFDQEGNIYVAEQIRPADQLIPPEFAGVVGPVTIKSGWPNDNPKAAIAQMYGSIVKFSPKGGAFDITYYKNQFGEPKLDPSFKTIDGASWICQINNHFSPNKATGALWMHMGISQISLHNCNCENTRFDVDPFGRVWYPDLGRYRVGVLDTNGNLITTFGSYGNAESRGPDSPVVDPRTGKVRPRRADDPKDLKSPFAEPEIAFSYLVGVGATDRYAYMGDSLNRRLLRAKLVYAAEESIGIK